MIKGILFDKDGTLIDFDKVWIPATIRVFAILSEKYNLEEYRIAAGMNDWMGSEDVPASEFLLNKIGINDGMVDANGTFATKSLYDNIDEIAYLFPCSLIELYIKVKDYFYQEITMKLESYPTFTNVSDMFKTLIEKNIKIGIATTDEYESTRVCLHKLGVEDMVSIWATANNKDNMPVKHNVELIYESAKRWKISPSEIAIVGDTPSDMQLANKGSAISIGVLSGTGRRSDLESCSQYIIDSVDQIVELIEAINCEEA